MTRPLSPVPVPVPVAAPCIRETIPLSADAAPASAVSEISPSSGKGRLVPVGEVGPGEDCARAALTARRFLSGLEIVKRREETYRSGRGSVDFEEALPSYLSLILFLVHEAFLLLGSTVRALWQPSLWELRM